MALLLCFVCIFSVFAGILLGQSVKTSIVMKEGIEGGLKKMFLIGILCAILAIGLSLMSFTMCSTS